MADTMLESLKLHLPDRAGKEEDALLSALLLDAGNLICALTWREEVPEKLHGAQVRLAVILFSRMGAEGETRRVEGDTTREISALPEDLKREILAYRMAAT